MSRWGETLYRKVGRRYQPMADSELFCPHKAGAYLVYVRPGSTQIFHSIAPANAEVIAAMSTAKEAMVKAISEKSRPVLGKAEPTSKRQLAAYQAYCDVMYNGEDNGLTLVIPCYNDIIEAGIDALKEAMKEGDDE